VKKNPIDYLKDGLGSAGDACDDIYAVMVAACISFALFG
jgi:hypothetical protein